MNSRLLHNLIYSQGIPIDSKGERLKTGDTVSYTSGHKRTKMVGKVADETPAGECIKVLIGNDPFPVYVSYKQLSKTAYKDNEESERSEEMAVATKPSAKELRKQAKSLGIEGYEDLTLKELQAAVTEAETEAEPEEEVAPARKKKSKKGKAKTNGQATKAKSSKKAKKAAKEEPAEEPARASRGNPYRPGSNLWHVVEELKTGGTRDEIAKRIMPKVKLYPRVQSGRAYERHIVHSRIMSTARALKKLGWTIKREGRGDEATFTAVPPRR